MENSTEEVSFPLHDAARRGNLNFLKEGIQQGVSTSGLDHASNTPLFWASHAGHLDCVQELLALPNPPINAQVYIFKRNFCNDKQGNICSVKFFPMMTRNNTLSLWFLPLQNYVGKRVMMKGIFFFKKYDTTGKN